MPIVGSFAGASARAYGLQAGAPIVGNFNSIQTITVGAGGVSSITFSSIPQTYQHLQIRWVCRDNRATYSADDFKFQLNGVTSYTSYANQRMIGYNTTVYYESYPSNHGAQLPGWLAGAPSASGGNIANSYGVGIIDIYDYTNTNKNKTLKGVSGEESNLNGANTGGSIGLYSGLFLSTAAITSIYFAPGNATTFSEYSTFSLYGVTN
jgi:hypothetical protein